MFILYAVPLGLIVGALLGGRLAGLAAIHFRWAGLALFGFAAQVVLFSDPVTARVGDLGPPLYVASTALVFVAVLRNLAIRGMPLVAAGAASNLAAIVANGGYMPTSASAAAEFGRSAPEAYSNSAIVESPALAPLTDVIPLPAVAAVREHRVGRGHPDRRRDRGRDRGRDAGRATASRR